MKINKIKLILTFTIALLFFQSTFPFIVADTTDGPLEISTLQNSYTVSIGNSVTITWSFSVPTHEYAVYWEIIGHGVNKSGWGITANCTTPTITAYDTEWIYNCSGYYARYHVWQTVTVKSPEIGDDGIYAQNLNSYGVTQWTANGTAINIAGVDQKNPQICSDGAGGAIITWEDSDIYAQKIDSNGVNQWTTNGIVICMESDVQKDPQICSDGAGGAIITWQDHRDGNNDIYAQRINANGVNQWDPNGTAICTESGGQVSPQIVSDGANGAIITWQDSRSGNNDIYAQRINANGVNQWVPNGTEISTEIDGQVSPQIVSDGANGAIITWQDSRSGNNDIYAQKIDSNGNYQWVPNGTAICTEIGDQLFPQIINDGANGAIITWQDSRSGNNDIYAQKIDSNGNYQWDVAICTAIDGQKNPQICSDGANGAIITWQDNRGGNNDIYIQKVNSSGDIQWNLNGKAICAASNIQTKPRIVSDGVNGSIITWEDYRDLNGDIYAQKINSKGAVQWVSNGRAICTENGDQLVPQIVSDGAEGAIITWDDNRIPIVVGDGNGDGDGDGNGGPPTAIQGFPPYLVIAISSICAIIIILRFDKSRKNKNSKN
ncbi:MAG: TolB family protein [Promethearchaeota archaeon]